MTIGMILVLGVGLIFFAVNQRKGEHADVTGFHRGEGAGRPGQDHVTGPNVRYRVR